MKKFLIVGGNSRLAKIFRYLYPNFCLVLKRNDCDITKEDQIEKAVKGSNFTYLLNCAAITDIEKCEKDPAYCFSVNSVGVYFLNKACLKYKKKLIHISSDYAVNPTNIYGWSKYVSEKVVDPKNLVIRTSFYSRDYYLIKELILDRKVDAYTNVYFNPISINRLAKEIYKNRNKRGMINIFSSKKISKYEFAKRVCKVLGLVPERFVKPVEFKNSCVAKRPFDSFVKTDINLDLDEDLKDFKKFLKLPSLPV